MRNLLYGYCSSPRTTGRVSSLQTKQFVANILTFSLGEIYGSEPSVNKKKNLIHIPWRGDLKLVNTFQIVLKQSRKEFPLRSGVGVGEQEGTRCRLPPSAGKQGCLC